MKLNKLLLSTALVVALNVFDGNTSANAHILSQVRGELEKERGVAAAYRALGRTPQELQEDSLLARQNFEELERIRRQETDNAQLQQELGEKSVTLTQTQGRLASQAQAIVQEKALVQCHILGTAAQVQSMLNEKLGKLNAKFDEKITEIDEKRRRLSAKIQMLLTKAREGEESSAELVVLRKGRDEAEKKHQEILQLVEGLKAEKSTIEAQSLETREQITALKAQLENYDSNINKDYNVKEELRDLKKQIEEHKDKRVKILSTTKENKILKEINAQAEDKLKAVESQLLMLQEQVLESNSRAPVKQSEELQAKEDELQELKVNFEKARTSILDLRNEIEEALAAKIQHSILREGLQTELLELSKELQDTKIQENSLRQEISNYEVVQASQTQGILEMKQQLEELESARDASQKEIRKLEEKLNKKEKFISELSRSPLKMGELEEAQKELVKEKEKSKAQEKTILQLNSRLSEMVSKHEESESTLCDNFRTIEKLKEKNQSLERERTGKGTSSFQQFPETPRTLYGTITNSPSNSIMEESNLTSQLKIMKAEFEAQTLAFSSLQQENQRLRSHLEGRSRVPASIPLLLDQNLWLRNMTERAKHTENEADRLLSIPAPSRKGTPSSNALPPLEGADGSFLRTNLINAFTAAQGSPANGDSLLERLTNHFSDQDNSIVSNQSTSEAAPRSPSRNSFLTPHGGHTSTPKERINDNVALLNEVTEIDLNSFNGLPVVGSGIPPFNLGDSSPIMHPSSEAIPAPEAPVTPGLGATFNVVADSAGASETVASGTELSCNSSGLVGGPHVAIVPGSRLSSGLPVNPPPQEPVLGSGPSSKPPVNPSTLQRGPKKTGNTKRKSLDRETRVITNSPPHQELSPEFSLPVLGAKKTETKTFG